jgi:hypothetical protein
MKERGVEEVAVLFPADARDHTELSLRRKKIDKIDQIATKSDGDFGGQSVTRWAYLRR